jgi:tetratricopeptide (TPR) repeat protein
LAIPAYKEAIRLNPKLEQGHLNLANAYLDINNAIMATNYYRSALLINPELEAAKRGLQRAQELNVKNQEQQNNPFGRLVNVDQLAHQKSASAIRNLSEGERQKDREEVLKLVKGLRNAARHASEELREKMQPALLNLARALIDGENRPDLISEAHDRFKQELPRFQEGMRYLKRSTLELRGHEELMNTPDLDV